MSNNPENSEAPARRTDPDFDGHLERPIESMSPEERLDWLWEVTCLIHAARRADGTPVHDDRDRDEPRL